MDVHRTVMVVAATENWGSEFTGEEEEEMPPRTSSQRTIRQDGEDTATLPVLRLPKVEEGDSLGIGNRMAHGMFRIGEKVGGG